MNKKQVTRYLWGKGICYSIALATAGYILPANSEVVGVSPELPLINFSGNGTTTYSASTGLFQVQSTPISVVLPPAKPIKDGSVPETFELSIKVDSLGNLVGGVAGDDLVVSGAVDLSGDPSYDADGVLLKGEIIEFGYRDTGSNSDLFDFVFEVTGGQLADLYDGQNIGLTMNSESSSFSGSFALDFSGKAKGFLGATPDETPLVPSIEICTLVTLNTDMVSGFSDADSIVGDVCDSFIQGIPVGVAGEVDGTYQLQVTNNGTETLSDVVINSPEFGLVNEPIPSSCGSLEPNEMCIVRVDDPNTAYTRLKKNNVCEISGKVTMSASTSGVGVNSGIVVSDDDPASVNCVTEPHITLIKEVSLNGGAFMDANSPEMGPVGPVGADAIYRITVINDGTEMLSSIVVDDATLGIDAVELNVSSFNPGETIVLTEADAGFSALYAADRCDVIGERLNVASVKAIGSFSGISVKSDDPAYITCENPQIELLKQVSIDGINFFDADLSSDDDVPVGIIGVMEATYRLIVSNIGTEALTNVLVTDAKLAIDEVISDLAVGETRVIDASQTGFENFKNTDVCNGESGPKNNVANVVASGVSSEYVVSDDNPANVVCIAGPEIQIIKQVRLGEGVFVDANTPEAGPRGMLGDDVVYQFVVKNVGDEDLTTVEVSDPLLDISGVVIADLVVGSEVVIRKGDSGFENLDARKHCDSVGSKLNTVKRVILHLIGLL